MKNILLLFLFVVCCIALHAQIPTTLSYQGLLTDTNGNTVADANYDITFNFYTVASGGSASFVKGPISVTTFKGLFTVILGNGQGNNNTALPYTLGSQQYYVGIKNGTQAEIDPRVMLTAVPYAFQAQTANTLDAAGLTGTVAIARIADGSVTNAKLATGIDGAKISTGINASNITSGTLPDARLSTSAVVPVGTIVSFGGTTAPTGWLLCDGAPVSKTTYANLFTVISNNFGSSGTMFNVPDLQGRFLRGVDGATNRDPDKASRTMSNTGGLTGNNVGSLQADQTGPHNHKSSDGYLNLSSGTGSLFYGTVTGAGNSMKAGPAPADPYNIENSTGSESRPKNVYVNYIIKY